MQLGEPASAAKVPTAQGAQLVEPARAAKFPGAQNEHDADAGIDANWPTAHEVQAPAPAPLKRPTGQSPQVVLPATGAAVPAMQGLQPAPAIGPALPTAQLAQLPAPASAPNPARHGRHLVAPVVAANWLGPQAVHGAFPVVDEVPSWHSPAGTPVGPLVAPVKITRQPTSIVPLLISRSHALTEPWPGTPSASIAAVPVVSMSLFHPTVLVNVARVKTKGAGMVSPLRSSSGTLNSTQSAVVEIAICEAVIVYQVVPANHSSSGLFEPATCSAS